MARFTPKKLVLNNINNGNEYVNGDGIGAEAINDPIEAMAYTQALATTQPDSSEAGTVGTPSVEIIEVNNLPKLKFKNLKGQKGDKGDKGDTGATAGSNPNLLINSNFAINQRGQSSYTENGKYTVDRWKQSVGTISVFPNYLTLSVASEITQYFETIPFADQILTVTININGTKYTKSFTFSATNGYTVIQLFANGWRVAYSGTSKYFRISNVSGNANDQLIWVKLEIGDTATGYTPPLIAEELPKCQRYYQILRTHGNTSAGGGSTTLYFGLNLIQTMRQWYTVTATALPSIRGKGTAETISSITPNVLYNNLLLCTVTTPTTKTLHETYVLVNGTVTIDAEIY